MIENFKDSDILARADRASKLLQDPTLTEAWDKVRLAILAKFESSPVRDAEGREHLYKMLKALSDVRGYLEQAVNDGKVVVDLREKKRLFNFR